MGKGPRHRGRGSPYIAVSYTHLVKRKRKLLPRGFKSFEVNQMEKDLGLCDLVFDYYESQILFGCRKYGDRLPSIAKICDAYHLDVYKRQGASTISELTALGVPAVIVPSPYVTNNHQEKNARVLERAGGAAVVLEGDASGQALFQTACGILHDGEKRDAMEKAMASLGIRDATERIYRTILEICQ